MHIVFTDEEKKWIETRVFGWPIKDGCPEDVKKSIEEKKGTLNNQFTDTGRGKHG